MDESEATIPRPTSSMVAIQRGKWLLLTRNICYDALRKRMLYYTKLKTFDVDFILLFLSQNSWLQIQRSRVRFSALHYFLIYDGSGTGSTQLREDN
jgi:hypothetical protein